MVLTTAAKLANAMPSSALDDVSSAVVEQVILEVDGLIYSYCRSRYDVPFTTVPPELEAAANAICAYEVLVAAGFDPDDMDTEITRRRNFYVGGGDTRSGWLQMLARGDVALDQDADATPSVSGGAPRVRSKTVRGWDDDTVSDDE